MSSSTLMGLWFPCSCLDSHVGFGFWHCQKIQPHSKLPVPLALKIFFCFFFCNIYLTFFKIWFILCLIVCDSVCVCMWINRRGCQNSQSWSYTDSWDIWHGWMLGNWTLLLNMSKPDSFLTVVLYLLSYVHLVCLLDNLKYDIIERGLS